MNYSEFWYLSQIFHSLFYSYISTNYVCTYGVQRYLALDDRVAWAYFQFPSDMFNGETMEEWVALSGKQGEGQEGNVNIILSFTVS